MAEPQDTPTGRLAMPDPKREVGRAVAYLIRAGLSAHEAARSIVNVTIAVEAQLRAIGITDITWIHDLWLAACVLEAGTSPEVGREDDTSQQHAEQGEPRWAGAVRAVREYEWGAASDHG